MDQDIDYLGKQLPPLALPMEQAFRDHVAQPVQELLDSPKLNERHRNALRAALQEMAKELCFLRFSLFLGDPQ